MYIYSKIIKLAFCANYPMVILWLSYGGYAEIDE